MSLGGVLGGLFNALLAPLLFSTVVEYPLMIAAACFARPKQKAAVAPRWWLHPALLSLVALAVCGIAYWRGVRQIIDLGPQVGILSMDVVIVALAGLVAFGVSDRPWLFGLAIPGVMLLGLFLSTSPGEVVYRDRSFFGVFRVVRDEKGQRMLLYHGSTIHGVQSLRPERRSQPLSYYFHTGPLGQLLGDQGDLSGPGDRRRRTGNRDDRGLRAAGPTLHLLRDRPDRRAAGPQPQAVQLSEQLAGDDPRGAGRRPAVAG